MDFEIFNWCGDRTVNTVLCNLGYSDRDIITESADRDVFDVARMFHEAGLSVMIKPLTNGNTLLGLDTRSFGQR